MPDTVLDGLIIGNIFGPLKKLPNKYEKISVEITVIKSHRSNFIPISWVLISKNIINGNDM